MKEKLIELQSLAYAPYSNFKVSAILVTNNDIEFNGVNVENASYGGSICAERVAILSAVSNGYRKGDFKKLYILNSSEKIATPCMICRQTFLEFFNSDMEIECINIKGESETYKVNELCPFPFDEGNL